MASPRITVLYPCYNQPDLLRRSLESLRLQTCNAFTVLLIDDKSTVEYSDVISQFPDMTIQRIVNKSNLGAVPNMIHCIHYPVDTEYKIVFHEDDIMHPRLLELGIAALDAQPGYAWIGAKMSFFKDPNEIHYAETFSTPQYFKTDLNQFVRMLILGTSLSLASIIYRSSTAKQANWKLELYSMLGDRHMLLEMGKKFGCAFIDTYLVAAYDHRELDTRWKTLMSEHIINWYQYLGSFFSKSERQEDLIQSGFTRNIVENTTLLPGKEQKKRWKVYMRLAINKLFSLKYFLLTKPIFHKMAIHLKRMKI